jgi:trans-L-3-hydroxyproline dehydratase
VSDARPPFRLDADAVPAFRRALAGDGGSIGVGGPLEVLDYHAAGEPFRIVTGGLPEVPGGSILERRRWLRDRLDHVREALMWEPRGHADMYGGILVPPDHEGAVCGVLFLHNEGYSTMCGHGTIALGTALIETGAVPVTGAATRFGIDAPCGLLRVEARVDPGEADAARREGSSPRVREVAFENVPSFAAALDATLEVPGFGEVTFDVGYGGAFYAILPAERLGLELRTERTPDLVRAARALVDAGRAALRGGGPLAERLGVRHPREEDLSFLYGAILTGPAEDPEHHDRNLCVFAEGEVDRSPTGSGVSARLAVAHARGEVAVGDERAIESILGRDSVFVGRIVRTERWDGRDAVVPEVRGSAHVVGRASFVLDEDDVIGRGFLLPR